MHPVSKRAIAARLPIFALIAAGAFAGLAGCEGSNKPKAAEQASRPAAALPSKPMAVTAAAACGTGTPHDQYAQAGIACATCHTSPSAQTVHGAAWMDATPSNTAFHGYAANQGLASCAGCHGAALDGVGGSVAVSCAACHGAGWKTSCTMCHGTAGGDGAPPKATWANSGDAVRTGTHAAHLQATHGLMGPVACAACHVVPADATSVGHIDGATASVAFSGLAVRGITGSAAWNRGAATCSNTYCHGATLVGGNEKTPVWTTTDGTQRACDSCHGAPPANAYHTRKDLDCGQCHAGYTATSVNVATHLDGTIQYSVTCTTCHGNLGNPATLTNIAPPKGSEGETATTALAVGAHAQHVLAANMQVANPFPCTACHVLPADQLHANGPVDLAFGTLANNRPDPWQASTYFTGTATAFTTTTMTDSTKNFGSRNAVRNQTIKFLSGTANGLTRTITNSSSTVVYWNTTQGAVNGLAVGTSYQIGTPGTPITPPAAAAWNRTTAKCSNTWCHGYSTATGGFTAANIRGYPTNASTTGNYTNPTWTKVDGTQDTCGGCHGNSSTSYTVGLPASGKHTSVSNHRSATCGRCHGGTYTNTVADKSLHVNGTVENVIGYSKATNSCGSTGSGCHGTSTMTGWY